MPFTIGENVGPYRIVEKLGQGGMATVFKAYHPSLDRYVAIKVLHPALQADPNFLARFQREARIVAKLDHPHIVPIYDFAEHRGHPYLVMRFVEGETLKAHLERAPLTREEVHEVVRAVGEALAYAHRAGVLHRDIKPSNIIITPQGRVCLTDFGVARMAEAGESTLSRDLMVGTPQYISPEQAKGQSDLDVRTDVYSLGVVLYELLVGRVPYQADTPYAVVHDHIFTPLPLPRSLQPNLPEPIERVLLKALAKDPEERFQSVEELVTTFQAAVATTPAPGAGAPDLPDTVVVPSPAELPVEEPEAEEEQEVPGAPAPRKKRRRAWIVAGVVAFLCLGCLGAMVVRQAVLESRGGEQVEPPPGPPDREDPPPNSPGDENPPPWSHEAQDLLDQARAARGEGDLEGALDVYREVIEQYPEADLAYVEAAELLVSKGEGDEALTLLQVGIERVPGSVPLRFGLVNVALHQWDRELARHTVDWLVEHAPDQPQTHLYDGLVALVEDEPCDEVRPSLQRALELEPNLVAAHYGLGICFLRERNEEQAREELEFVLEQGAEAGELYDLAAYRLAILDAGLEQSIRAEFGNVEMLAGEIPNEDLRQAFKDYLDAARLLWELGNGEEAIGTLEELNGQVHENPDVLGRVLARRLSLNLRLLINMMTP